MTHRNLSDDDIDLIRELREEHGLSYKELAAKFDLDYETVRAICQYKVRCKRND
jgi:ribosome-binding protein aMBF1 (putative translation factor)